MPDLIKPDALKLHSSARGRAAAGYATRVAQNTALPDYLDLSGKMCWVAALYCAVQADALSKKYFEKVQHQITFQTYSFFVCPTDAAIVSAIEMRALPQGCILAFFDFSFTPAKLVHAMISSGAGFACGNKNSCIGVGRDVGWESHNLAEKLKWAAGTDGFTAPETDVSPGKSKTRILKIRYRPLELMDPPTRSLNFKKLG